jgi:DNA-binding CsgD family transcriptional regulator
MPNIAAECLLAALRFASLWTLFYLFHRPRTGLRRVLAIGIMALQYPFCRILFFAGGGNFAVSVAADTVLFLTLAFICEAEPAPGVSGETSHTGGDLTKPLISALYFDGMLQLVNYILGCYMYAFAGTLPPSFSAWSYFWKTIEGTFLLFWTLFYYRIARNMTAEAPISFSLLTIFTPLAALAVAAISADTGRRFIASGENIFLCGGLFGTLIVALNMCVFYLYTKLIVAHEALIFAQNLSPSPPVWTPEQGISAAFIEKYDISAREREVIEAMVQGKTDKEIAVCLDIAVNTVQVHLKRIYRKTGAAGRFALSALVRGG